MDIWDKEKRSDVMRKIKGKNTKPELILRSALFKQGYRFRIHGKDLPGKPDIVLPKYKTIIFVHGCFWHYHKNCPEGRIPYTNSKFWKEKLEKNVVKDKKHNSQLKKLGWNVIIVWECEVEKKLEKVLEKIDTVIHSSWFRNKIFTMEFRKMNIEKIFEALSNDQMNSAFGIICAELEKQDYSVTINNIEVTAEEFFDKRLESLEQSSQDFNILLKKDSQVEQEFSISFVDYHKFVFKGKNTKLNYKVPNVIP